MYIINAITQVRNMYINATTPLQSRRESAIKDQIVRAKSVTPKEYCDKWVTKRSGLQSDEWGYASACVRELARVLGCSEVTIRKWGKDFSKHPEYVELSLSNVDKLNAIAEILQPKE